MALQGVRRGAVPSRKRDWLVQSPSQREAVSTHLSHPPKKKALATRKKQKESVRNKEGIPLHCRNKIIHVAVPQLIPEYCLCVEVGWNFGLPVRAVSHLPQKAILVHDDRKKVTTVLLPFP